jgi:hypothetical protein
MSVPENMIAIAEDIMRQWGVPAKYLANGAEDAVDVTVRCKPQRRMTSQGRTFLIMEVSVLSSEVAAPGFGDVVTVDGDAWKLSSLPLEFYEIASHLEGALWQLTLVTDARPTRRH